MLDTIFHWHATHEKRNLAVLAIVQLVLLCLSVWQHDVAYMAISVVALFGNLASLHQPREIGDIVEQWLKTQRSSQCEQN